MEKKLYVEVCNAADLMPKDGTGSSSPYCVIDYDGQRRRTETKQKDLNPVWNATVDFIMFADLMEGEMLEVNILSEKRPKQKQPSFLGRVRVSSKTFVRKGKEEMVMYKLERRSLLSQVKGQIGLKIWWDEEPAPADPPPADAPPAEGGGGAEGGDAAPPPPAEGEAPPAEGGDAAPPPPAEGEGAPPPDQPPPDQPPAEQPPPEQPAAPPAEPPPPAPETHCLVHGTSYMDTLYWDHNYLYPDEVPWNNFIPSTVFENPYENF